MKFKIDENLPVEVAQLLNNASYDAMTVVQQGMAGVDDHNISEICRSEQRVLVTLDLDFANNRAYPPHQYPGIIVFRLRRTDKKYLLKICTQLISLLEHEQLSQRLWIVEESRIRIRGEE